VPQTIVVVCVADVVGFVAAMDLCKKHLLIAKHVRSPTQTIFRAWWSTGLQIAMLVGFPPFFQSSSNFFL